MMTNMLHTYGTTELNPGGSLPQLPLPGHWTKPCYSPCLGTPDHLPLMLIPPTIRVLNESSNSSKRAKTIQLIAACQAILIKSQRPAVPNKAIL